MSQQRFHDVDLSMKRGHMQAGMSLAVSSQFCVDLYPLVQEEIDDISVAVRTRQSEALHHLGRCRLRVEIAVSVEEALHNVKSAQTCRF